MTINLLLAILLISLSISARSETWIRDSFQPFYRYPSKEDSINVIAHDYLTGQLPNRTNYKTYFALAKSHWELKENVNAERMFKNIESAVNCFYSCEYIDEEVPGNIETNPDVLVGCCYKNIACRYLAKICIEKDSFLEALRYIEFADRKYSVKDGRNGYYNAGLEDLYLRCYSATGMHSHIVQLLLPETLYSLQDYSYLISAIKRQYCKYDIDSILNIGLATISYKLDTSQINVFGEYCELPLLPNFKEKEILIIIRGTATIELLGKTMVLPLPREKVPENVTLIDLAGYFKQTSFYKCLHSP